MRRARRGPRAPEGPIGARGWAAPAFWSEPAGLAADLLTPFALAWQAGGRLRRWRARPWRAPVPVVCVGNLVAGGAGKTPVVMALAARLREAGIEAHVVARGYGGRLIGPVRVDPVRHDAARVGDEPLLLAECAPTWVARERAAGVRAAAAAGAPAILLDDGFQNPAIAATLSLIVVDAEYGYGNGRVIPAGPLRESLTGGLARADAVILLAAASMARHPAEPAEIARAGAPPVVPARLVAIEGERFAGRRLYAFAGIGRPEKFFATLRETGAAVVGARAFPDHCPFAARDLARLRREAARLGARLVTTRKDFVRLPLGERGEIAVLDVAVRWPDPEALARLLAPILGRVEA